MFQVVVFLHKGAITEVILVYNLKIYAKFSREFAWGFQRGSMIPRGFDSGVPNS